MDTYKIAKKYCTEEKVQVMFSNAPRQIICSKDGYLYLRDGDIKIHKYLTDSIREKMPYRNRPDGRWHATHLFKYDQVYVKFTRYRRMNPSLALMPDGYSLSFLYFHKLNNGEAIASEMYLGDFKKEKGEKYFSKKGLEEFLYGISDIKGKYIFEWEHGIQYAKSPEEIICIDGIRKFLDLSDEAIINSYNIRNMFLNFQLFDEGYDDKEEEKQVKIESLDEIKEEFSMIGGFNAPILVEVSEDGINVYEFDVIYCGKDNFKVEYEKTEVKPNIAKILNSSVKSKYTPEPDFDE